MIDKKNVVIVIVTYQPDLKILYELILALKSQINSIVIVDNNSSKELFPGLNKQILSMVKVHPQKQNYGIAKAHNIGIDWAKRNGAEFVLLMDQDSQPDIDMVENLLKVFELYTDAACAGPRYMDVRQNNPPPFIRISGLKLHRCICETDKSIVPVDYMISSGCMIPIKVLEEVGGMSEDLFIDYVDIEWGIRAKSKGYQSYGVCAAKMQHSLGEEPIKFFGKSIPLHSPLRHYYHFRNAVHLYKQNYVPLNWKIVDGWRLILKYGFYTLFAKPRFEHWKMMTIGLIHGILGKSGKYMDDSS